MSTVVIYYTVCSFTLDEARAEEVMGAAPPSAAGVVGASWQPPLHDDAEPASRERREEERTNLVGRCQADPGLKAPGFKV